MIHIATVHWESDKWIDIQLEHINKNLNQPYRIYTFLSGQATLHNSKFYFASCAPVKEHAVKLNILADIIVHEASSDDDVLIFIDGDAFPIKPIGSYIENILQKYPLAAIQRIENVGDIQPHPSFCVTTVGFWKSIKGDWLEGYKWQNANQLWRTDVGGNLLKILNRNNINWHPILRTKGITEHPLMFGIYEGVIYHHGSGFRTPMSMYDRQKSLVSVLSNKHIAKILDKLLKRVSLKNRFRIHRILGINKKLQNQNSRISENIFQMFVQKKLF